MAGAVADTALQIPLAMTGIAFAGGAIARLQCSADRHIGAGAAALCAASGEAPGAWTRFLAAATALLAASGTQTLVTDSLT